MQTNKASAILTIRVRSVKRCKGPLEKKEFNKGKCTKPCMWYPSRFLRVKDIITNLPKEWEPGTEIGAVHYEILDYCHFKTLLCFLSTDWTVPLHLQHFFSTSCIKYKLSVPHCLLSVCEDLGEEWVADKDLDYGRYPLKLLTQFGLILSFILISIIYIFCLLKLKPMWIFFRN